MTYDRLAWAAYEHDNARASAEYERGPVRREPAAPDPRQHPHETSKCTQCGAAFEQPWRGRRRQFCRTCRPPKEQK